MKRITKQKRRRKITGSELCTMVELTILPKDFKARRNHLTLVRLLKIKEESVATQ
jgi:hypothetical protein